MARDVRNLLIVDNRAASLFYWGMLLKRLDYKVVSKRSAEEALKVLEDPRPAVVLTEVALPGMDGIALLKVIKEDPRYRDIPVVMLASTDDAATKDACTRLGCAAWFPKDVEPDDLYQKLQSLIETTPRSHIRLNTSVKVIVGDGTTMGGSARTEFASAISEGGLYVRTQYPQPQNALTPVRILLNDNEVRAKTVVVYSYAKNEGPYKEPGMGVKFVEISDRDRRLIRTFINEQLTKDITH
ncbi:MAG: response regulator [Nitrospirae bacterium]|nr:response regulator [Nitrospirota bacterium]